MFMFKDREWFLSPSRELDMFSRRSYFSVIIEKDKLLINYVYVNLTLVWTWELIMRHRCYIWIAVLNFNGYFWKCKYSTYAKSSLNQKCASSKCFSLLFVSYFSSNHDCPGVFTLEGQLLNRVSNFWSGHK